jgi:integrase
MVTVNLSRKHGIAALETFRDRLRIRLPRTCFGGKQKYLSLGLYDTPTNRAIAQRRLDWIQGDIDNGQFDPTLERYQSQAKQPTYLSIVSETSHQTTLKELWDSYLDYLKPIRKASTIHYLNSSITIYINKCPVVSPYSALEVRNWLVETTTPSMAKRVLTQLNAAFKWALKHKKLSGSLSPFEGMASEFKHRFEVESKPCAFTNAEKIQIISSFRNHKIPGRNYSHYTSFVEFLFLTGCRPNEAVGLKWDDIDPDYRFINFDGGIFCTNTGKRLNSKGSKNNSSRKFPCNQELREFLQSLKRTHVLVFPSKDGRSIHYNNFVKRAWHKIVDPIKPDTTPYSCRDTFITEQIAKGVSAPIIAKWVDNSVKMIEKHYLDMASIDHILPQ